MVAHTFNTCVQNSHIHKTKINLEIQINQRQVFYVPRNNPGDRQKRESPHPTPLPHTLLLLPRGSAGVWANGGIPGWEERSVERRAKEALESIPLETGPVHCHLHHRVLLQRFRSCSLPGCASNTTISTLSVLGFQLAAALRTEQWGMGGADPLGAD